MSIKLILGTGLEIGLDSDSFQKLHAFQDGGEFWSHQYQQVIREFLGEFLPAMEERADGNSVLCQMFDDKKREVASRSWKAKKIPASEIKRLDAAVERLKKKAADPATDATIRKIIENFRLPDATENAELYRLYESSWWRPKLMVVWGCEKEEGTSVVPEIAAKTAALLGTPAAPVRPTVPETVIETNDEGGGRVVPEEEVSAGPSSTGNKFGIIAVIGVVILFVVLAVLLLKPRPKEFDQASLSNNTKTAGESTNTPDSELTLSGINASESTGVESPANPPLINGNSQSSAAATESAATAKPDDMPAEPARAEANEGSETILIVTEPEVDPNGKVVGVRKREASTSLVDLAKITRPAVVTLHVVHNDAGSEATGTGFLISPDGLLVSNHHVIEKGKNITAQFADGTVVGVAEVVAADPNRDLAVLKLQSGGREYPFLRLEESDTVEVGQDIAVIGSPRGLHGTFAVGIVSAKRIREKGQVHLLQITVPISPGSSGSPVVDLDASVIGVAVGALESGQALNFAIAVSELHSLLDASNKAAPSMESAKENEALNEKNPADLPQKAAFGRLESEPTASPGGGKTKPGQPSAEKDRIEVEEIGRRNLPGEKIELKLRARYRAADGVEKSLSKPAWVFDGEKLDAEGVEVSVVTSKGKHDLEVQGKDPDGAQVSLTATIGITLKISSEVDIKVTK
jgi:S1-C subfamily serine protease